MIVWHITQLYWNHIYCPAHQAETNHPSFSSVIIRMKLKTAANNRRLFVCLFTWRLTNTHSLPIYPALCRTDVDRDSSSVLATRYGLDGPGIGSRWGRDFSTRPWGPPSLLYNGYRVSFLEVKRPGRRVAQPSSFNTKVKERVELYFYSLSGCSWSVICWTLITYMR